MSIPFDAEWFGSQAEHVTLYDAQAEAEARELAEAKDVLRKRLLIITADHEGKRLNERKWRWAMDLLESL